jgi:CspA family cold shock protein
MARWVERGVVKWFDSRMGYGFVVDAEGRDVFLHRRVLRRAGRRTLDPGELVEYEAEVTPRGIKITRLVVLSRPPGEQPE